LELTEIYALIAPKLTRVEERLRDKLDSDVPLVPRIASYVQQSGGKRIRPAVFLLFSGLCGYEGDRDILYSAVFECIHTATLIHDDIIDSAELRRGHNSVNTIWGNNLSVLFGDYLYLKALNWSLEDESLRIINILSSLTTAMVEGELLQSSLNGSLGISEDEYLDIITRKTANLFAACGDVAAIISDCPPEQVQALHHYGLNLGMAFQVTDDLLDLESEAEIIGKPVNHDVLDGKLTLPLIRLLKVCPAEVKEKVGRVVETKAFDEFSREEMRGLLEEYRVFESTRDTVSMFCRRATDQLQAFSSDSPYRKALLTLPEIIANRRK
jgi:octaprenyl-diphosphate synthase